MRTLFAEMQTDGLIFIVFIFPEESDFVIQMNLQEDRV